MFRRAQSSEAASTCAGPAGRSSSATGPPARCSRLLQTSARRPRVSDQSRFPPVVTAQRPSPSELNRRLSGATMAGVPPVAPVAFAAESERLASRGETTGMDEAQSGHLTLGSTGRSRCEVSVRRDDCGLSPPAVVSGVMPATLASRAEAVRKRYPSSAPGFWGPGGRRFKSCLPDLEKASKAALL